MRSLAIEDEPFEQKRSGSALPARGRYVADDGRWNVQVRVENGAPPSVRGSDIDHLDDGSDYALATIAAALIDEASLEHDRRPGSVIAAAVARAAVETLSADLQWRTSSGTTDFYLRTRPQLPFSVAESGAATAPAIWLAASGDTATGSVTLRTLDDVEGVVEVTFTLDDPLDTLDAGFRLTMHTVQESTTLREMTLEIACEAELNPPIVQLAIGALEIADVLEAHGIDLHPMLIEERISAPAGGTWGGSDIFTQLNDQLGRAAQTPLSGAAWKLHLMLLSRTDREGLIGVMFDFADEFPRQGAAVFLGEVARRYDQSEFARRVLTAAVHELGHSMNLTHRFLPEVGQTNSLSFMNYDWMFEGGAVSEFWKRFRYRFDRDELDFLLHGPRSQVIPGGDPFGSARYWITGDRPPPTAPPVPDLRLQLTPPEAGTTYGYGQPIYLQVSLRNVGRQRYCVPRHILDAKAGMLSVLIQRPTGPTGPGGAGGSGESFAPFMRRCFDVADPERIALSPGEALHDNLNLTFGASGFPFAEPGDYVVTPEVTLYNATGDTPIGVVRGASLPITVSAGSAAERRDADVMFQADAGMALALGGASCLDQAVGQLAEIAERRAHESTGRADGLVAATLRMQGIQALRLEEKGEARTFLRAALSPELASTFDPHTREHTERLADSLEPPRRAETSVAYLDLSVRDDRPRSIPGVLLSRTAEKAVVDDEAVVGEGIGVLVRAGSISSYEGVVAASVKVWAADGLTEQVAVTSIQRFASGADDPDAVALAMLARPVPTTAPTVLRMGRVSKLLARGAPVAADDVYQMLADNDISLPEELPHPVADMSIPGVPMVEVAAGGWDQVAFKWCRLFGGCQEPPPASSEDGPIAGPHRGCWSQHVAPPAAILDPTTLLRASGPDAP